ncbi:hypothetical protein J4Q44_G00286860 [Coregonus suidteri]|uniref:Uncharacterized protein n=1 Tax=Coregonus suidteri TaxID=861788 RepID=A0AAN8QK80_9TELE
MQAHMCGSEARHVFRPETDFSGRFPNCPFTALVQFGAQGLCVEGQATIQHGRTRRRNQSPVYWLCQVLQCIHNHRQEELCLAHICKHSHHRPLLQVEAQETGGCHGKVMCPDCSVV